MDPLAGRRNALNRGEIAVLVFADCSKCPLEQGYTEVLRSCTITIGKIQRKLIKGEWRWEARVTREVPDVIRIPASQHGQEHPAQYVKTSAGAVDGAGEEVPEDYQAKLAAEGRQKTTLAGAEQRRRERQQRGEARHLVAAVKGYAGTVRFYERQEGRAA